MENQNKQNLEMLQTVYKMIDNYANEAIKKDYPITQEERDQFGYIVRLVNGVNNWL